MAAVFVLIALLLPTASPFIFSSIRNIDNDTSEYVIMNGTIMLGGLVAVYDAGGVNDRSCNSEISPYGIQRVEAMRYAISQVMNKFCMNFKPTNQP